jgi:hypothetical protein
MTKLKLWLGMGTLVGLSLSFWGSRGQSASSDKVCFEAENAKTITEYFVKRTTPFKDQIKNRVSSGGYLEIVEDIHEAKGLAPGKDYYPGSATYEVNIPSAGSYYFWAQTWWGPKHGCSNSFWVKFDDQADQLFGEDGTYEVWTWRKLKQPISLPAGKVKLVLKDHEDGIRIDQIFLTKSSIVPVGKMAVTPGALVP